MTNSNIKMLQNLLETNDEQLISDLSRVYQIPNDLLSLVLKNINKLFNLKAPFHKHISLKLEAKEIHKTILKNLEFFSSQSEFFFGTHAKISSKGKIILK